MSWSGIVLVLLFLAVILGLGFRPRQPWVIHAHMNKMFMKIFFTMMLMCSSVVLSIKMALELDLGRWIALIMSMLGVIVGVLLMLYVLYWSQPFSRKRTGVKAVDKAVERYKKPGEDVDGAWAPPMEINGKCYWNIYYTNQNKKQWLVLDQLGQVLHDETTAHTLRDMLRLVYQFGFPEYINNRTSAYMSSQKSITGLKMLLKQFESLMLPVRELNNGKYVDEIFSIKQAAEVGLRFQEGMCRYWLYEAEWGNKHGGAKLKEFRFSDWQELIRVLHDNTLWMREEIEPLEKGALAARNLLSLLKKQPEIMRGNPSLKHLLQAVITQYDGLKEAFIDLREGRVQGYECGMDDELGDWRSRLAWVRQVDNEYRHDKPDGIPIKKKTK